MLAAVVDPAHWPPYVAGGKRDQEILRIEFAAGAKPAADIIFPLAGSLPRPAALFPIKSVTKNKISGKGPRRSGCRKKFSVYSGAGQPGQKWVNSILGYMTASYVEARVLLFLSAADGSADN